MNMETLLNYVRKTNPGITEEKLTEELKKSEYAARSLIVTVGLIDGCGKGKRR